MIFRSLTYMLTTASQNGGWLPETSRSFHCWQPAPRWRLLPWLANPGNPAMSPHAEGEKKTGTCHTDKKNGRKGRDRGGETASKESLRSGENANTTKTLTKTPNQTLQCPMDQEHEESWRMRIYNKPMTTQVKLVLLVVNSVKLHLNAL